MTDIIQNSPLKIFKFNIQESGISNLIIPFEYIKNIFESLSHKQLDVLDLSVTPDFGEMGEMG